MTTQQESTAQLLRDLSSEVTRLVHQEIELAKAEMAPKTKRLLAGSALFGVASVIGLLAAGALVAAAIAAVATALSVWLAALVIGGGLLALAGMLALAGRTQATKGSPPVPIDAIESTKEDVEWLKTQAKSARP